MGEEAPECITEKNYISPDLGVDSEAQVFQTTTIIDDKLYVVGGSEDSDKSEIRVKIFDRLSGKWSKPTVLGTKPMKSKGHSAVLLENKRILIIKRDSDSNDCTWFLEVDTPFVREQKKLLGTEVVAWSKGIKGDGPKPIVISGPSGVGKGTLICKLMKEFPSTFGFSVSHTTRAPREKEVNGTHYHFSERSTMEKDISEGKFLESALVHGNLYGTSIESVDAVTDVGKRCILDIDVQGARSVRASSLEAIFIFICPPSFNELENRLRSRGTETEEQVQKRLRNAKSELEQGKSSGLFDHILVNDDLKTCYQNLKKLLALDVTHDISYQTTEDCFKTPMHCSLSQNGEEIILHCDSMQENSSNKLIIDVSSLKGGAPSRTRGVNIFTVSS